MKRFALMLFVGVFGLLLVSETFAGPNIRSLRSKSTKSPAVTTAKAKPGKTKSFKSLTKDKVAIEGLFTFYHDTTDQTMLMAIKSDQIGPIYLCGESRVQSEGSFFDHGAMLRTFPFYFKRVGQKIMLMERNLRLRADSTLPVYGAVRSATSDFLVGSTDLMSEPKDSTEAYLVDASKLFIKDASNVGYFLGQRGKTGHAFDAKNSYFESVKSFPQNSEISVKLHFKSRKPSSGMTLQNPYSFYHTYHYSLSTLPETDYKPRVADDRIGYFLTQYYDYNNLDSESPYVRYINRWHLKKKNPDARVSEPVEPIVFWVENTTPEEYRDAIAEAIEFWNPAFEALGFRNAVVAKQMPDDADWDPADVRYNVIQWMVNPGNAYAVGPSRANPFTGQIYDADIRLSSDWIRYMFASMENMIGPMAFDGSVPPTTDPLEEMEHFHSDCPSHLCTYQQEAAIDGARGLSYLLSSAGDFADKDSLTREYVHAYLVEIVAHEVGHTLGLRHNFKASSIYSIEQLQDPEFTRRHSTTGSIMDYMPAILAEPGAPQGEFYASVPGPWDYWVIEYGYSDWGDITPEDEQAKLTEIASRAGQPELIYLTDEDTFGWSTKSIDPLSSMHDYSDDPLSFAEHNMKLTQHLWNETIKKFDKPGNRYPKLRSVFGYGWRSYSEVARIASKYPGGIYHRRNHIGDEGGDVPFRVVPAAEQRRAVATLDKYLFAPDAFDLPQGLLNKLQPERFPDFMWSSYRIGQLDYPIHQYALRYQRLAIDRLYDPLTLGRLVNNLELYDDGAEKYTMFDMFTQIRQSIWTEAFAVKNTNSFRRQLQLAHLDELIGIYLAKAGKYPFDAYSLAAHDLELLHDAASKAAGNRAVDGMTRAHFGEVVRQIDAARGAKREFSTK